MDHELGQEEEADVVVGALLPDLERGVDDAQQPQQVEEEEGEEPQGYVIFTLGLGIGDTDIFDWGGLLSALIGTFIVLGLAGYFLRRRQPPPTHPSTPGLPGDEGPRPTV